MKHLFLALLFITTAFAANAQTREQTCHFGIAFEISDNPSWGYGEPVVVSVDPYSPAEKAGVKVGDIIMEVNNTATYLRNYETIANWFFQNTEEEVSFTIRNLDTYFKEYRLSRICKDVKSLSESDLATAFSFYSIEDTHDRSFTVPVRVETNKNVDYSDYHTFDFMEASTTPGVDAYITSYIEKALTEKGLTRDTQDPDFIIQTYYSFQPNVKFNGLEKPVKGRTSWRFDTENQKMVLLPILSTDEPNASNIGEYVLELGLRFFDKKYISTTEFTQIWDCSVQDYLTNKFDLAEYTRIHAPLLLMQFPYSNNRNIAQYTVSFKKYNYTGMSFNMNDMITVLDVDMDSPAYLAGIRRGDVIEKINDAKFIYKKDELTDAYKRFFAETMVYRDPLTKFTDAKGFPDAMFWSKSSYDEIAKLFKKSIYATNFSYLYDFEKYVLGRSANTPLMIEAMSRNQRRIFKVIPEIRSSVSIRTR